MKKGVIAELQSTYDTGFLTSCMEIDELVNNFKERQDEFDNGGIFVEIYDNETVMNTDVNVSKIAACIRKYIIKGDVNKDLAVYVILEVDVLDTPMGRKLINNNSSPNIEVYILFDRIHKKFLIVDVDEYLFKAKKKFKFSSIPFFNVGLLTEQKEVSDKISEEDTNYSDTSGNEDVNDDECQDSCGDNRFKIIEKAKEAILESTNIESSPEEMAVLDNFLFRCWQMGWLRKYEDND